MGYNRRFICLPYGLVWFISKGTYPLSSNHSNLTLICAWLNGQIHFLMLVGNEITLCKYVSFKYPPIFTHHRQYQCICAGWVVYSCSNDTARNEHDFFLGLMGGDTKGVSVGEAEEQPNMSPGAAWPSMRVHVRMRFNLRPLFLPFLSI